MLRSLLLVAGLAASSALAPTLTPTSPGGAQAPPPATGVQSALLDAVEEAASVCLSKQRGDGSEGGLSWCDEPSRKALERSIRGLRGRKLAWWLDTPLPLRAAYTRGPRLDISVVALPGDTTLPALAYPSGALILVAPLLGQATVRTLSSGAPAEEVARTALRAEDDALVVDLEGGAAHEFQGTPGVASAFLQVVLLPPCMRFPSGAEVGAPATDDDAAGDADDAGAAAGRRRVPQAIRVAVSDLLRVERPLPGELGPTGGGAGTAIPDDAPQLLARLSTTVGGLDGPISAIVRRALASRLYPRALTKELGVSPVRGMLLYGPPGCGKTLLAREIAAAMGAREPKIVNGPEMMSKFVGDSEQFIRGLFAEAEVEQAEAGDASALHVIVFDEIDAFTRERGSLTGDTSGIRDSVVNQLLAKMDGVEQLDNILVIGLTNRAELIDSALLRPGRLEVQVEVPRPDAMGRQQILSIQSGELRERGCLAPRAAACLSSGALAKVTRGFSGADIAGLMRSATSYSLERYVDEALRNGWDPGAAKPAGGTTAGGTDAMEVHYEDIVRALREASPRKSFSRRPKVQGGSQGGGARGSGSKREVRRRLGTWWRETRLAALTERAMVEGTLLQKRAEDKV